MSNKEELVLQYLKEPTPHLKSRIVEQYARLVELDAQKLTYNPNDIIDLVQVGMVGLLKSLDQYNPALETRFTTFAVSHIMGEIRHYLRDKGHLIKIPRRIQEHCTKINQYIKVHYQTHYQQATVSQISAALGISEEHILEAMEAWQSLNTASLDSQVHSSGSKDSHDGSELLLMDSIGVESKDESILNRDSVYHALSLLPDRERQIIYLRFYESLTQAQIANKMQLSQMHISRLLNQALHNLRHYFLDTNRLN